MPKQTAQLLARQKLAATDLAKFAPPSKRKKAEPEQPKYTTPAVKARRIQNSTAATVCNGTTTTRTVATRETRNGGKHTRSRNCKPTASG